MILGVLHQSDDERTESEGDVAESEKADDKTVDDEKDDEGIQDDEEKHDDDEIADEEKVDKEMPDLEKANKEMADAEKDDAEKIEEEKVDDEQARADQAAKYDQAGALISVTHEEKPKLPPSCLVFLCHLTMNPPNLLKSSTSSTSIDLFMEYDLRNMLYNKIQKSGLFHTYDKHLDLYNALIGSIDLDEAIAKGEIDATKVLKKRHHDDKDPSADFEKKKQERNKKDSEPSKDKKQHVSSPKEKTTKDLIEFVDLMGFTIDFSNFIKHRLKKDKITKANLEIPVFKLLKGTCKSSIELKYHLEQCYLVFSDQMDWKNPKGDRCPYDLRKPLSLQGPRGHLTILIDFFFNNNLEYLKTRKKERKYTTLISKTKAARVKFDKQFGYGYLEEIVVRRVDQKEYTFKEGDFPRLHMNDIEDMLLLHVQNKLFKLPDNDIVIFESYLEKLNITKPQTTFDEISFKEPYTTTYDLKGVVYLNKSKRKRLIRADELYKFSDRTLKSVHKTLHERLQTLCWGITKTCQRENRQTRIRLGHKLW
nr:hypothetical protein [Tanacetum cinerariifolium]